MTKQHDVFLSYKREDAPIMRRVRDALRADGINVWTDEYIEPGTEIWKHSIDQALKDAKSIVVLCSKEANQSRWVHDEIAVAELLKIPAFMMLIKDDVLDAIPGGSRQSQYIDARDKQLDLAIERLRETLVKHLKLQSITQLEEQIQQLQLEKTALENDRNRMRRELHDSSTKARETELALDDLKWRYDDLLTQLATLQREKAELDRQLKSQASDSRYDDLLRQFQALQRDNNDLQTQLERTKRERDTFKQQKNLAIENLESLKHELDAERQKKS